jgi:hypothetical protein
VPAADAASSAIKTTDMVFISLPACHGNHTPDV